MLRSSRFSLTSFDKRLSLRNCGCHHAAELHLPHVFNFPRDCEGAMILALQGLLPNRGVAFAPDATSAGDIVGRAIDCRLKLYGHVKHKPVT